MLSLKSGSCPDHDVSDQDPNKKKEKLLYERQQWRGRSHRKKVSEENI